MRLGLVSATYPFGTKEPYLDAELRALAPALDAAVVYPAAPQARAAGFAGVPGEVVRLPLAGPATLALAAATIVRRPGRVLAALATLFAARYPVRAKLKNFAVVPKGLALAEIARRRRLDHLHAYWLSTPATVAWIAARAAGIPFSATAHRWDVYEDNFAAGKLRDATFVRTISERGRADLLARTGADPAKVRVVRLGVAIPAAVPAERLAAADSPLPDDAGPRPLRILCAAALVEVKGHRTLLAALELLKRRGITFACTLAGAGPLREEIARTIAAGGLEGAVTLAGTIPHDELLGRLAAGRFDVAVLASLERPGGLMEGVPVALVEAMACGCAVVATSSGSIPELVDAASGILVPHSDPEALAAALERLARDPELRARLAAAGRERVRAAFDLRATSAELGALLASARAPAGDSW